MFALPSQPAALGERLLHDGRGIDENLHLTAETRNEKLSQTLQFPFYQSVIVSVTSIDGNGSAAELGGDSERVVLGRIGHAQGNHAPGLGPEILRMTSLVQSISQPSHIAMIIGLNELNQPLPDFVTKVSLAKAHSVETQPECLVTNLDSEVGRAEL